MIRALLFDFDGLLVDTESPSFAAWADVYREHGHELTLDTWSAAIGTLDGFDPVADLEGRLGRALERDTVNARRRELEFAASDLEELREGVADYLHEAERLGLERAIVSSSGVEWITRHLQRLDLLEGWNCIVAANGDAARAKPRPTLYLEALDRLRVTADEAIAFEDSPNGITAASAAGIYCVAVPNPTTAALDVTHADLVLRSLEEVPLAELLRRVEGEKEQPAAR
jgi:beta-phosphoglucomutase-like phosphatase (HAD superfamily)